MGDEKLGQIDVTMDERQIADRYRSAVKRLIIVDYDGVLVPEPERPGFTIPRRETKAAVQLLTNDPMNTVMLMSSRDRSHLDLHWGALNGVLVAEYGAQYRERRMAWSSLFDLDDSWMDQVARAMQTLPMEYDGSFIERRSHTIAWRIMQTSSQIASDLPKIVDALRTLPGNSNFEVHKTKDRVEIAPRGVDPGSFVARWIGGRKFDFVIALGGERVSESLFRILTHDAVTVSVCPAMTSPSQYRMQSQSEVVPFLRSLPGTA